MSNLLALSVNSACNALCALSAFAPTLTLPESKRAGFGLAYYKDSELLSRMEPTEQSPNITLVETLGDLSADILILHAREATTGSVKLENTHPFRFQNWAMAHNGTLNGFEKYRDRLLAAMPTFVKMGIRGDTDSEHIFHLFLSFLYDAGKLGKSDVNLEEIRFALSQTFSTLDEFALAAGFEPSDASVVISDGYSLAALCRGIDVNYKIIDGLDDCDLCRISSPSGPKLKDDRSHKELKGVLVMSPQGEEPLPPGVKSLESGQFLTVSSGHQAAISKIQ